MAEAPNVPEVLAPVEALTQEFHQWREHENRWWRRSCRCSLDAFVAVNGLRKAGLVVTASDDSEGTRHGSE